MGCGMALYERKSNTCIYKISLQLGLGTCAISEVVSFLCSVYICSNNGLKYINMYNIVRI